MTWKEQRAAEIIDSRAVVETSFGQLPEEQQARILEERRALPLMALLARHEATHEALLRRVRTLSDEELNTEQMEGLPPDERFWKVVAGATWWGYRGFVKALRRLLAENAAEAGK